MTDIEYEIIDELYFLTSFADLKSTFNQGDVDLEEMIWRLISKGWVRMTDKNDNEIQTVESDFHRQKDQFYFIVTKSGLLAHNQR